MWLPQCQSNSSPSSVSSQILLLPRAAERGKKHDLKAAAGDDRRRTAATTTTARQRTATTTTAAADDDTLTAACTFVDQDFQVSSINTLVLQQRADRSPLLWPRFRHGPADRRASRPPPPPHNCGGPPLPHHNRFSENSCWSAMDESRQRQGDETPSPITARLSDSLVLFKSVDLHRWQCRCGRRESLGQQLCQHGITLM